MLIVPHQKRTMEIAGMLYGISLNNDGTTKVVAQRLENQERAEAAARVEAEREAATAAFAAQSSAEDEPVMATEEAFAGPPVG